MTSTQKQSLDTLRRTGRDVTIEAAVLANIQALGPICRDALCKAANIRVSSACATIDTLKKKGLVAVHPEKVWNHTTQRNVQAYVAIETLHPPQGA